MTGIKKNITIIIPALNEEGNLEGAFERIRSSLGDFYPGCEIIIINDGSQDATGKIADCLAAAHPEVRVIHHAENKGVGYCVEWGYAQANREYVMWYPGDNPMSEESLRLMFSKIGEADLILSYVANPEFRSFSRRAVSWTYVFLLNLMFGLRLRYYNAINIYRTKRVCRIKAATHGFANFSEILIRLAKRGYSYLEVPTYHSQRTHGKSKAFRFKNFRDIAMAMPMLRWELWFSKPDFEAEEKPVHSGDGLPATRHDPCVKKRKIHS